MTTGKHVVLNENEARLAGEGLAGLIEITDALQNSGLGDGLTTDARATMLALASKLQAATNGKAPHA
jgi:hypothetical protein